ncbi:hypothetical protein BDN71DRAFT_1295530 [Pleurotus eryngii]|uniref:Uncharacterized protein n=1 Tax=Pleurotus eryngii TaxID=5323 RepID=A0A9P5ZPQ4_PLEER|nr:hypothetical protein BDN71DRAFT_1295530 [Pleurotus eryngii]
MDIGSYASSPTKAVSDARCPDITTHRALLSPQTWTFRCPLVRSCFKASPPTLPPPHFPPLFDIRFRVAPRISCACEQGLTPPESQITLIYLRLPSPRFSLSLRRVPRFPCTSASFHGTRRFSHSSLEYGIDNTRHLSLSVYAPRTHV